MRGSAAVTARHRRFAKSWTANTMSLLLRVPLLLVLAHAGMNPHWANFTTLVVLFGLRFWISDRFIWGTKQMVADITGEPVEPPTPGGRAHRDEAGRVGPHMALNLRVPRGGPAVLLRHPRDRHIRLGGRAPRARLLRVAPFTPRGGHHCAARVRR